MLFSPGVKLWQLICDFNLTYLPTSLCGKMFRSYLESWEVSFSFSTLSTEATILVILYAGAKIHVDAQAI